MSQTHTAPIFKPVDVIYEINGNALRSLLDENGIAYLELAKACGYTNASRVSHLFRGTNGTGKSRIGHKALKPIVEFFLKRQINPGDLVDLRDLQSV